MLRTRALTAALLGPLTVAVVVLGEPWFALFIGIVAFLAMAEVVALLDAGGFEPPQVITILGGLALTAAGLTAANEANVGGAVSNLLDALDPPGLVGATVIGVMLILAGAAFTRGEPRAGFVTWAMSTFGTLYVGLLLPSVAVVTHLAPPGVASSTPVGPLNVASGIGWGILLLLVVWGYDTGAYLVGRWVGRHRLVDHISPSKTIEGVGGGLVLATTGAVIGGALLGLEGWHALLIGPIVGLAAQAGDLAESMLKRAAGRKESGFLVPGHGGILDRIDSFLFAAPVLAGYALLVAGRVV